MGMHLFFADFGILGAPPLAYVGGEGAGMSVELIVAGFIGVFLLVYLVYSMIRPDRF